MLCLPKIKENKVFEQSNSLKKIMFTTTLNPWYTSIAKKYLDIPRYTSIYNINWIPSVNNLLRISKTSYTMKCPISRVECLLKYHQINSVVNWGIKWMPLPHILYFFSKHFSLFSQSISLWAISLCSFGSEQTQ